MLWVFLVIWILAAVMTAWIFRLNGRPWWIGAVLGVVFGVPAAVVSLIVFMVGGKRRTAAAA